MIINGVPQKKPVFRPVFMQKKPVQTAQKHPVQAHPPPIPSVPSENFIDLKQKVISYIRMNGPVIPIQIAKAFGKDTMFAGAVLSELISNRILKITNAKIGSSPIYYLPGQEDKLELLRNHLGKMPKEAYDILKEMKVVRDSECEPWQRVALRELKDFAEPIAVRHDDGSEEIFWRWHLFSDDDARKRIKGLVEGRVEEVPVTPAAIAPIQPKPEPIEPNPEPINPSERSEGRPGTKVTMPEKPDIKDPKKKEQQKTLEQKADKVKPKKPKKEKVDAYKDELLEFLQQKGLDVLEEVPMKKNEYGFVVRLESHVGKLSYMAIAKKKKKLSDDDVLLAYSVAQHHKLPLIIMAKELSKKAEALLEKEAKGVVFLKF